MVMKVVFSFGCSVEKSCAILSFAMVCVVILGSTLAAEEESLGDLSPAELREFFLAGYTTVDDHFKHIDIAIRWVQKTDPEWLRFMGLDPNKGVSETITRYAAKGGKERNWFYESPQAFEEGKSRSTTISDGVYVLSYHDTKGTKDTETQRGRASLTHVKDASFWWGRRQVGGIIGDYAGYSVKDILSSPNLEINPEPQEIDGMECYEVSAPVEINRVTYQVHYWLCPDYSCLPVRFEVWGSKGRSKLREFSEFEKLPDGSWFPKKMIHRGFSFALREGEPYEVGVDTFTIERMELAPELDEDTVFDTSPKQLPVGCLFQDKIAGAEYVIGEGPLGEEYIEKLLKDIASESPEVTEGVSSREEPAVAAKEEQIGDVGRPARDVVPPAETPARARPTGFPGLIWFPIGLGALAVAALALLLLKRAGRS